MAAEAQNLFDLIDSYWFGHRIFKKPQNPPLKTQKTEESTAETSENLDFSAIPTINIRSYSDQLFINPKQQSFISESVLNYQTPKLETIFSGKESKQIKLPVKLKEKSIVPPERGRSRRNNSKSKSLSELEFEELKGFMDLGFMFSEKDKDSSLVSIIPGLQRLGKDVEEIEEEKVKASRPYLSEAWSDLKNKSEEAAIRTIKIPALGDETEIKHQLRFWAHSVASVVR